MRHYLFLAVIFLAMPTFQVRAQTNVEFDDFDSDLARFHHYAEMPYEPPAESNEGLNTSGAVELVGRHALTLLESKSFLVGEMITVSAFVRTGDFLTLPETGIRLGQLYLTNASNGHAFQHAGISAFYASAHIEDEGSVTIGGIDLLGTIHLDFLRPPYPEFMPHSWYELSATFIRRQNPKVDVSFTVTDFGAIGGESLGIIATTRRTFNSHSFELWNQPWYVGFATDDLSGMIVDRFSVQSGLVGDFDGDGDIDGRDFLAWQRNTSAGDLADWQNNFGSGGLTATSIAVPEPGSLMLVGVLMLLMPARLRCASPRG